MLNLPEFVLFHFSEKEKKLFKQYLEWKSEYHAVSFTFAFLQNTEINKLKLKPRIAILSGTFKADSKWFHLAKQKGIFLIYSIDYFISHFQVDYFTNLASTEQVFLLENRPSIYTNLKSIFSLFSISVVSPKIKEPFVLKSWKDIENSKSFQKENANHKPVIFINLDLPGLDIVSFLSSLRRLAIDQKRHKYLHPELIPVKDFSRGNLYSNLISGLKSYSRAIYSDEESMHVILYLLLQNSWSKNGRIESQSKLLMDKNTSDNLSFQQAYKQYFQNQNKNSQIKNSFSQLQEYANLNDNLLKLLFLQNGLSFWFESLTKENTSLNDSLYQCKLKTDLSEMTEYRKIR